MIVIEHEAQVPVGEYGAWLPPHTVLRPSRGDALPERAQEPIVVLGGTMNALADAEHPWLAPVRDLMADAVEREVPLLGICLGAQMLAAATGGEVVVSDPAGLELGVTDIRVTAAAAQDPLFAVMPERFQALAAHSDGVRRLPAHGVLLAESDRYTQAFRVGACAWGVQFHPEVDLPTFHRWARNDIGRHADPSEENLRRILLEAETRWAAMEQTSRTLAERFGRIAAGTGTGAEGPRV
ncbi:MAG: type 1 glutamine amidotransferase [bacterium]|nr:type 1 glutamine amidotransferase [bacterium]